MQVRDLGELDGPLLIFGGPYSNLQATQAVIVEAERRGIAPERMICTGDIVAYCAQPAETVAAICELGCAVVAGNCERQLAARTGDCGCGFEAGTLCDRLSAGWYAQAEAAVSDEVRDWMAALPDVITFAHDGRRHAVIHGGARDISRFLWPVLHDDNFIEEIDYIQSVVGDISCVLAGHCGLAFTRRIGAVDWVNAGAIGMPPNDGRPETAFAILERGRATLHRLPYAHEAAQAAMRAAGLTQGYDTALGTGYWPSEEVLPPALRRAAVASG
ncbi:Calcineurin-like phosphoesterase superfamily domain-containing protein [Roseovarius tolerans]|uniref:Calcineurin-like phosphoesterase superfamily domain-containing protein n=1 Tax=Roseovarius tolerans TaxID=74031 RepID=A0A1H7W4G2_9RHOB|nr:metallophosphoesterase family protein [Roseovarius tolerans]SEM15878.1 Calcineurin-like phosphoesterase superfamily domain-containing protein [Roseovarius tolerans]